MSVTLVNKYKLIIPVSPDTINRVIKYGKKEGDITQLKNKWQRLAVCFIGQAVDRGELPARFRGRIGIFFRLFFETFRTRDGDNYTAMCKGILDAIVSEGLIPDDNVNFVDDNGRRLRHGCGQPRVEVYIDEHVSKEFIVEINAPEYYNPGKSLGYPDLSNIGRCKHGVVADPAGPRGDAAESVPAERG